MAKAKGAFRTISEVADWLDTPTHVLRFWESKFSQIKPVKGAGGRRYYRPADMELIAGIKQLLHVEGLTIKGAQKLLREKGIKHVATLGQTLADKPAPTTEPKTATKPPQAAKPSPVEAEAPNRAKESTAEPQQDSLPFDVPPTPTKTPAPVISATLSSDAAAPEPRLIGQLPNDLESLRPKADQIAPLLARLEALRDRMAG